MPSGNAWMAVRRFLMVGVLWVHVVVEHQAQSGTSSACSSVLIRNFLNSTARYRASMNPGPCRSQVQRSEEADGVPL